MTSVGTSITFRSCKIRFGEGFDAVVVRLGTPHHALRPPVLNDRLRRLSAWAVEAVKGPSRQIDIELRTVGGELPAQIIEYLDRQTAGIGRSLHHDRRHGADQHQLGDPPLTLAVLCNVARRLTTAGRVADMDRAPQVEMLNHCGGVSGVVIHVVTIANLRGSTMAAAIMGDDPIALVYDLEHLRVPVIGTQRPTMMEDERLGVLGTPIFVENLNAILGGNIAHGFDPFGWQIAVSGARARANADPQRRSR